MGTMGTRFFFGPQVTFDEFANLARMCPELLGGAPSASAGFAALDDHMLTEADDAEPAMLSRQESESADDHIGRLELALAQARQSEAAAKDEVRQSWRVYEKDVGELEAQLGQYELTMKDLRTANVKLRGEAAHQDEEQEAALAAVLHDRARQTTPEKAIPINQGTDALQVELHAARQETSELQQMCGEHIDTITTLKRSLEAETLNLSSQLRASDRAFEELKTEAEAMERGLNVLEVLRRRNEELTDLVDEQKEKIAAGEERESSLKAAAASTAAEGGKSGTPSDDLQFAMDMLQAEVSDLKAAKQKADDDRAKSRTHEKVHLEELTKTKVALREANAKLKGLEHELQKANDTTAGMGMQLEALGAALGKMKNEVDSKPRKGSGRGAKNAKSSRRPFGSKRSTGSISETAGSSAPSTPRTPASPPRAGRVASPQTLSPPASSAAPASDKPRGGLSPSPTPPRRVSKLATRRFMLQTGGLLKKLGQAINLKKAGGNSAGEGAADSAKVPYEHAIDPVPAAATAVASTPVSSKRSPTHSRTCWPASVRARVRLRVRVCTSASASALARAIACCAFGPRDRAHSTHTKQRAAHMFGNRLMRRRHSPDNGAP